MINHTKRYIYNTLLRIMSLRGDNPSRYSRYHLKRDHAGVSLASSSKSSSLKRASLLSGLLFVFILPSVLNIEHRARKHHHYSSSSEYSRGGANSNSNNNNVRLRFKTREENHRENDRLQHEWCFTPKFRALARIREKNRYINSKKWRR